MPPLGYLLTALALCAFAANSLLCRFALGGAAIEPQVFTALRLGSGAITLTLLLRVSRRREGVRAKGASWREAAWLVLYALPFSVAYAWLDTGTGALLLFGAVQLTMFAWALRSGERPSLPEWLGLLGASGGLVFLVSPGLTAPDPWGAACMVVAGVGWGLYTVAGKRPGDPLRRTSESFVRATVLVAPLVGLALVVTPTEHPSVGGVVAALVSGSLASGLGYAAWYAALRHLTATRAALLQLFVPILAAASGIALLGEPLTTRWLVSAVVVLGSLAFAMRWRAAGHLRVK